MVMAIEVDEGGTMITGADIHLFNHMRIAAGLGLEINTGMKLSARGSIMQVAAKVCGSSKRTKKGVLKDYVAWMSATYPAYRPNPSVLKALGK
jgi:hypothetical protein